MALKFPSKEWADAFKDAVNANEAYRKAAANWTEGAVAFVCRESPEHGIDDEQGMVLDLRQGECRGVVYTDDFEEWEKAPFVIEADYDDWKSVIKSEVDPILAMMQGMLKLAQGDLPTMLRDIEASKQLVVSASHVDTDFPE